MINNAPAPDVYIRPQANEIFDTKADKSETYTKTDTDTLLDSKADNTDTYIKTETDTLLDDKADKTDTYTKPKPMFDSMLKQINQNQLIHIRQFFIQLFLC
ncbi:MAG: hypothetical protein EZS28_046965 [Streblomastix strix]|uniref:Uncharacterized protein n=1 Tax=Streblomastix strix TaxID=222440 RepID=A0A5J4TH02_9EUKA|nr:MAG: hypothetical protein EZS28_046965 [Streblomastix strix]